MRGNRSPTATPISRSRRGQLALGDANVRPPTQQQLRRADVVRDRQRRQRPAARKLRQQRLRLLARQYAESQHAARDRGFQIGNRRQRGGQAAPVRASVSSCGAAAGIETSAS